MKDFLHKVLIFALIIIGILIFIPVNQKKAFNSIENDCFDHASWISDRIYENDKKMDVVFLGSSRSVNAINDRIIEENLLMQNREVVNLSYCRLGRNLHYSLFKEVLMYKNPKVLFLEVRDDEYRDSHPMFFAFSSTVDVVFAYPFFNKRYLLDLYNHLLFKFKYFVSGFFDNQPSAYSSNQYGVANSSDTTNRSQLEKMSRMKNESQRSIQGLERDYHMNYPRYYLKKIHELCVENNIDLYFLYFPDYKSNLHLPHEYYTYLQYGEVLIPPNEIFNNVDHFYDNDHLNQAGSVALSTWIAEKMKTEQIEISSN